MGVPRNANTTAKPRGLITLIARVRARDPIVGLGLITTLSRSLRFFAGTEQPKDAARTCAVSPLKIALAPLTSSSMLAPSGCRRKPASSLSAKQPGLQGRDFEPTMRVSSS